MDTRKAFTLVELLVVIAIIALLVSILLPSIEKVREQAQSLVCRTNMKNLSYYTVEYLSDWDDKFWSGWDPGWPGEKPDGMDDSWVEALLPYGSKKYLLCPLATRYDVPYPSGHEGGKNAAWGDPAYDPYPYVGSYGENGWCWGISAPVHDSDGDGKIWGEDIASFWQYGNIRGGNNIPLFLDSKWDHGIPTHDDTPPSEDDESVYDMYGSMGRYCINRHHETINALFFDGTVRKVGLKELWTLQWRKKPYFDKCNEWTLCGGATKLKWAEYGTGWMKDFKDY